MQFLKMKKQGKSMDSSEYRLQLLTELWNSIVNADSSIIVDKFDAINYNSASVTDELANKIILEIQNG